MWEGNKCNYLWNRYSSSYIVVPHFRTKILTGCSRKMFYLLYFAIQCNNNVSIFKCSKHLKTPLHVLNNEKLYKHRDNVADVTSGETNAICVTM